MPNQINPALLDPNAIATVGGTNTTVSVGPNPTAAFNPTPQIGSWAFANVNQTAVSPQGASQAGGSRLVSDISQAGDAFKFLNGSTFSALNKGVDAFGSSLGFADPFLQGPTTAAFGGAPLGTSAAAQGASVTGSLGGALGGAGFGFAAGGFLAGLVGGNKMGGSIGGAIGGALGATFLGGMTGVELGATLGSVVPGIGTVIGAVAGSLLGGMFGGGKPHPATGYSGGTIKADGTFDGGKLGAKHLSTDIASGMRNDFQSYLQGQAKKYGVSYANNLGVAIGYDPGQYGGAGSRIAISTNNPAGGAKINKSFNFDMKDAASRKKAYEDAFNFAITSSGLDPKKLQATSTTGAATNITIPAEQSPSAWQQFLDKYRQEHPYTTPQNPPKQG